tara:strand:- start:4035 stop:4337 length:303 start_codon:yes stop_codon:yes gene_type:complete
MDGDNAGLLPRVENYLMSVCCEKHITDTLIYSFFHLIFLCYYLFDYDSLDIKILNFLIDYHMDYHFCDATQKLSLHRSTHHLIHTYYTYKKSAFHESEAF